MYRACLSALLIYSPFSWSLDYYQCKGVDGAVYHQLERCPSSLEGRLIKDDLPPVTTRVDGAGRPVTTQVLSTGAHYLATGQVNGVSFPMMVDTGATYVVMSRDNALRSGVPVGGRILRMQTANGLVYGYLATAMIQFSGHTVANVPVVVQSSGAPSPGVLLGMSFLRNFDMNINGGVLSLTRK